jgi:50S ribosomal protein L16 3-hydroxylase
LTGLANFDVAEFLGRHWQRTPLFIPGAVPGFRDLLEPEELAGLALEDDVEARIVTQRGNKWELDTGPFGESSFQGEDPWTLLVQSVDQHIPAVAELRRLVSFLPSWRIDDIMVSYATDGGGVGPHYDNYDVFLLQGSGQRRWQIGQRCESSEPLLPHPELRLLANFRQEIEYLLNPGDILYVPPRVAHWGTAIGECTTYSIGLRAPRLNDMLSRWVDNLLENMDQEEFYRDPEGLKTGAAGEIDPASYRQAQNLLRQAVEDTRSEDTWFGELLTEPRYGDIAPALITTGVLPDKLRLDPSSRLAWSDRGDTLTVFANGLAMPAALDCRALLTDLCAGESVTSAQYKDTQRELILQLYGLGCIDGE